MVKKILVIFLSIISGVHHGESLGTEAELVYPQLFSARDELGTRQLKINDKVTLTLKKSSLLHDEFFLLTHPEGVPLRSYPDVEQLEEGLFHDEVQLASVFLTQESGIVKVEGVVGPNLKIRPLEGMERANEGFFPHALEPITNEQQEDNAVHGEHVRAIDAPQERQYRSYYRQNVKDVYVEIRVVVDAPFRAGFNRTKDMVRYLMLELNVVRLRYLTVSDPAVHLRWRAIEVLSDDIECEYYVYLNDYNKVDGIATIYRLADYVEAYQYKYGKYDVVSFLTGYDMVRVSNGKWEASYRGFAFVGSVCNRYRVGFSEDYAYTYAGIRVVAHELAHTLGCSHDGDEEGGYLDGYYANSTGCPWSQGYLMSYIVKDANSMKFSKCCNFSISIVAWSQKIDCLHTITSRSRLKHHKTKTLPGVFLSRDRQCKLSYLADPTTFFNRANGTRRCVAQCGVWWNKGMHYWDQVLLDGSTCGAKRICVNGNCVKKRKWYTVNNVNE
ncbi:metalloproteinase-like [Haemaphysalis longicornis]